MIDIADGSTIYYYHYDRLRSVVALSNGVGNIVESYTYDVFGEPNVWDANGDALTVSSLGNPYMFTGRRFDTETGLYYYRARYYEPKLGRFLQTDPIGYLAGLTLYTYCANNPLKWVDPWGLAGWLDPPRPRDNFWGPVWDIGNTGRDAYHAGAAFGYGAAGLAMKGIGQARFLPPDQPLSSQVPPQYVGPALAYDYLTIAGGLLGEKADDLADEAFDKMRKHADESNGLTPVDMGSKKER